MAVVVVVEGVMVVVVMFALMGLLLALKLIKEEVRET